MRVYLSFQIEEPLRCVRINTLHSHDQPTSPFNNDILLYFRFNEVHHALLGTGSRSV